MTVEKQVIFTVTMDASEVNRLVTDIACLCEIEPNDEFKRVCMDNARHIINLLKESGYYEKTPS